MTLLARLRTAAVLLAASAGLSACAEVGIDPPEWPWQDPRPVVSSPAAVPSAPAAKPAKPAPARMAAKPERKAKPAEPQAQEVPKLVGLSEAETAQLLGQPAEESAQPPGKVWVYKAAGCRLAVHLFPDMEKGGFYTLDTTAEEGAADACLGRLAADARKKE
ncbi:MAG: hypothetical protein AB1918_02150 [Pseudomonadota bacterium]